jgi:hypothetical protein
MMTRSGGVLDRQANWRVRMGVDPEGKERTSRRTISTSSGSVLSAAVEEKRPGEVDRDFHDLNWFEDEEY